MKLISASVILVFIFISCNLEDEKEVVLPEYSSIKLVPEQDSVYMNANNETRQFSLVGSIINVTEKTITNSGVMTDISYVVRTVDTSFQNVDPAIAKWYTSNSGVVSVSNGLITAKSAGYAQISASIGNATSLPVVVNVRAVHTAPGLSLNPPDLILIMQNFTDVSGTVQKDALLSMAVSNGGPQYPSVAYGADGSFTQQVTGLSEGMRVITAKAVNPNDATKFTERSKSVLYYAPNTPGANAIVGNWLGTTLGKDFNFRIAYSPIFTRYDIEGTIEIDFKSAGLGLGKVQDIDLVGFLDRNGSINVSLSKESQGFKISGAFSGHFSSTGKGSGKYNAQATRSGWPKISFNDVWTAVKLP